MTDRDRLLALLASLPDTLPAPETWTGRLQRRAQVERRPSPRRRVVCELCEGRGRLHSLRPCTACGGDPSTGEPGRGFRVIDDYTGQEVASEATAAKAMMVEVRCDRCAGAGRTDGARLMLCVRCSGSGRVATSDARRIEAMLRQKVGAADSEEFLIDALDRRDRDGSYADVERALAVLREQSLRSWRLVMAVCVDRSASVLADADRSRLERALMWMEVAVPKPIRLPARLERPLVNGRPRRRREAVVALLKQGLDVAEVVRRSGLSRSRVYEIRARWEADQVEAA